MADGMPRTELVGLCIAIGLIQKLAYSEIDQVRSFVKRSVVARRHNDVLPVRPGSVAAITVPSLIDADDCAIGRKIVTLLRKAVVNDMRRSKFTSIRATVYQKI